MTQPETKHKKRFPVWAASILGLILSCMAGFMIAMALQLGAFTFWRSLSSPPSGAVRIVDVEGYNIWVEAGDGNIYEFSSRCSDSENCNQWISLNDVTDILPTQYSIDREKDCHGFWGYPLLNNPFLGKVTECVNASVFHPEVKIDTFFALMSDGTVRYTAHEGLDFFLYLPISTIISLVLIAIILFRVYRGSFVLGRNKLA